MRSPWIALALVGVVGCGKNSSQQQEPDAAPAIDTPTADAAPLGDILDELKAISGMTVEERSTTLAGYRFFVLTYDQPADHHDPSAARFGQRMTLLHRDYAAPVVVHNSGYNVSTRGARSQLTQIINGNQLSMEHRFFSPSRPDPADWTKLNIEQAATDQHRIIDTLKQRIYAHNKWLTTGASKGGMTSLFHRRFFPDDVDATVAFVAPIDYPADAAQSPTNRYIVFLDNVGTDPACRTNLKTFQNTVLARRAAMKTRMAAKSAYLILGQDKALEFAVEEMPFIFWQYGSQTRCSAIPANTATDDAVFKFFDDTIDVTSYGDASLTSFLPYYHQSSTQLGYPIDDESYLVGLMFRGADTAQAYVPAAIPVGAYDNGAAMTDVQSFISSSGARIMLIYGQNDPWSAGAVSLGNATDSFRFFAPGGNHGSSVTSLASADQTTAMSAIMRWAGLQARIAGTWSTSEPTLESEEFAARRR
jgi:PS-10 peptidase S37